MLDFIKDSLGSFLNGFFGGILDGLTDTLTKLLENLGRVVEAFLAVFDGIPALVGSVGGLSRSFLWFIPPAAFRYLMFGISLVFLILLMKFFIKK